MQEYKILISEDAWCDLQNIHRYVTEISFGETADVVIQRIRKKIETLNFMPERMEPFGVDRRGLPLMAIPSGRYRIIYTVKRGSREVIIARVMSVSADYRVSLDGMSERSV